MKQNSAEMKEHFGLPLGCCSIILFYASEATDSINFIGLFERQHLFDFRRAIEVSHLLFWPGLRFSIFICLDLVNSRSMSSLIVEVEIDQLQNLTLEFRGYSCYYQMDQY